ncbi:MAG: hypothetical protein A4E35_01462 [Methanoregula sp. PtaU1.Bin051]|nr:MAG: hypothetical protein A4E35_01462 [Methanoregula sp. PtaU1.Bin051]
MESTTPFIQKLSIEEREQYAQIVDKWTKRNVPAFIERINNEIDTDRKHQEIVRLCAKSFADTELAKKTGYEFYFAEPLIEFGNEKPGNRSFDLLLYNESTHHAIFISCKSSVSDVKKVLSDIQEARDLVEEKIRYLVSDCVGDQLTIGDIEYVLCVHEKDSQKIIDSILSKKTRKMPKSDSHEPILWIYYPRTDIIQIHADHTHKNSQLTEMLLTGAGQDDEKSRFDLPYCSTSHPYRILQMAVVGDCYAKQRAAGDSDPKIINRNTLMTTLMRNISLGAPPEKKKRIVQDKMDAVIQYGKKFDVLVPLDDQSFKLNCRGEHINTVRKSLEDKFITNWSTMRAREEAEKKAVEDITKKRYPRTLTDFGF